MSEYAPAGSWQTPLDVAHAFLGVQEEGGKNRGPMIDRWVRFCGLEPEGAHPWCACFVSWCCAQVGYGLAKGASVRKLLMRNPDLETKEPLPGDICLSIHANGTGHCGFYIKREEGRIWTIDGNTNEAGSREGDRVAIRARPVDYWDRFLRPIKVGSVGTV